MDFISVIVSILAFNALLYVVHYGGRWGVVATWIPGKLLLLLSQWVVADHHDNDALVQTLEYTWAACLVPVVFLNAFHVFLCCQQGREQRFRSQLWCRRWTIATVVAMLMGVATWAVCEFDVTKITVYIFGTAAFAMNILNIIDAPQHLNMAGTQLTWSYVLVVNMVTFVLLAAVGVLVQRRAHVWAAVLTNAPLFSIALMANAALLPQADATKNIRQQTYMLAYQTWPSLGLVATAWLTIHVTNKAGWAVVNALVALSIFIGIQYYIVRKKF